MLSLQAAEAAAVVAGNGGGHSAGPGKPGVPGGMYRATGGGSGRPDPVCMSNASLHALQNLQPWADDEYDLGDYGIDIPSLGRLQGRTRGAERPPSSCDGSSRTGSPVPIVHRSTSSSSSSSEAAAARGVSSKACSPQSLVVHNPRPPYSSSSMPV